MEIESLRSKAITATVWATIEKFALLISQFIIGIILARLLTPSDFGVIALTTIFISISNAISDGGFESALIQKKELSEQQINTAFYINVFLGCTMALILFVLAPNISNFFNEPKLINILRVLSLVLPMEALGQTQRTLLMRELKFKKISVYQIVSSLASGILGVTLAYCGFGVWSLVYSTILALAVRVVFLWIRSSWYPRLSFSFSSISGLIPFGLNVLSTSILFFFIQQFNGLVIGKFYNEKDLGLFNRGIKFPEIVISIIQGVVLKMSLPLFSKLQDEGEKLNLLIVRTNSIVAFVAFPALLFFFLDAKEIILFLLTSKWVGCIIYFKMFCVIKLFDPFITIQRDLLLAKGKSKKSLALFVLTSALEIIPVFFVLRYGIMYIIWIALINKIVQYLIYLAIESKGLNFYFFSNMKLFMSYSFISLVVSVGVKLTDYFLPISVTENLFQKIFVDFSVGGILYLAICYKYKNRDVSMIRTVFGSIRFFKSNFAKA